MEMNRREFGKILPAAFGYTMVGGGLGAGQAIFSAPKRTTEYNLAKHVVGINDARNATDLFVNANSGLLMALYVSFFPEFMIKNGFASIEIFEALRKSDHYNAHPNRHRLDALPAAAAAHFSSYAYDQSSRDLCEDIIISSLADNRREVREIVLQNLISSTLPNDDVYKKKFISQHIFDQAYLVAREALEADEFHLIPAQLATEFLLNALWLCEVHGETKVAAKIDLMIADLARIESPHSWVIKSMHELHKGIFVDRSMGVYALPPQSSELLMGWKSSQYRFAQTYSALFAVMRVQLASQCYAVMVGESKPSPAMSIDQAAIAFPKIIDFIDEFDLLTLLAQKKAELPLSMLKTEARNFYDSRLKQLVKSKSALFENSPTSAMISEEKQYSELVPFAQYTPYERMKRIKEEVEYGFIKSMGAGAIAGIAVYATGATKAVERTAGGALSVLRDWMTKEHLDNNDNTKKEEIEELSDTLSDRARKIDAGEYKGLEEMQASHGDIPDSVFDRLKNKK